MSPLPDDPRIKVLLALIFCICVATIPVQHAWLFLPYMALLILALITAGPARTKALKSTLKASPFILILAGFIPFLKQGDPIWQLGFLSVSLDGLQTAGMILTSALLCIGTFSLVAALTPEDRIIAGLRGIGLPAILTQTIAFMLRYLHVLRPELHRLRDARDLRTIGDHGPSVLQSSANLLGSLFLRTTDRAQRVSQAMLARGFDGSFHSMPEETITAKQWTYSFALISLFILIRFSGRLIHE